MEQLVILINVNNFYFKMCQVFLKHCVGKISSFPDCTLGTFKWPRNHGSNLCDNNETILEEMLQHFSQEFCNCSFFNTLFKTKTYIVRLGKCVSMTQVCVPKSSKVTKPSSCVNLLSKHFRVIYWSNCVSYSKPDQIFLMTFPLKERWNTKGMCHG